MKSIITTPGTSETIIREIAAGTVTAPGLAIYGSGEDGALTLVAHTVITITGGTANDAVIKDYTDGDLNGYILSGQQTTPGRYVLLHFNGTLDMDGGEIRPGISNDSGPAGGASAYNSGVGGTGGNGGTLTWGRSGRYALWVYARTIIGTGTISVKGGDGQNGGDGGNPGGTTTGNPGSSTGYVSYVKGTTYSKGFVGSSSGGGANAAGNPTGGNGGTGGLAYSATILMLADLLDVSSAIHPAGHRTLAATVDERYYQINSNSGSGASGGAANSGSWYVGGGGGGGGGACRGTVAPYGGGLGSTGQDGQTDTTPSSGGGGGGGGLAGGFVFVFSESIGDDVTVNANGGQGGDGGLPFGTAGEGGGGGGGEGGYAIVIAQDGCAASVQAGGGAVGARGSGGAAGGAGLALLIAKGYDP